MDGEAAAEIGKLFVEAIAAPSFTPEARERFATKRIYASSKSTPRRLARSSSTSRADCYCRMPTRPGSPRRIEVVTWRPPTAEELRSLLFAWRVCKHVKSNAIVYARDGQTVGVGAGQMSRVDAASFGAQKAILPLQGTVAASDAFFPFPDGSKLSRRQVRLR